MRFLLVEAAQVVMRSEPEWRQHYFHLSLRRGGAIAKVALARKLAVRLFCGANVRTISKSRQSRCLQRCVLATKFTVP